MKRLTEILKDHKGTIGHDIAIDLDGYNVPEPGETVYEDNRSIICTKIRVYKNGLVIISFNNGSYMSGIQVAEMVAAGKLKIKQKNI